MSSLRTSFYSLYGSTGERCRQNDKITGLRLYENNNTNIKILQYADDTTLFVKHSRDIKEVIQCLELFGKVAGTEINIS